jgi:WD40 repeat protein
MLEQVIYNLERQGQIARIKKLVFCANNDRWSNDAQSMSGQELQQNLQSLCDRYPTMTELQDSLNQIVARLNHRRSYQAVVQVLCRELEPLYYDDLPSLHLDEAQPLLSSELEEPGDRVIHLQIPSADQPAQIMAEILINGQTQTQLTIEMPSHLVSEYGEWQVQYRQLGSEPGESDQIYQCQASTNDLLQQFHDWFKGAEFQPLRQKIQQHLPSSHPVQVVVSSADIAMLKLPWYLCLQQLLPTHPHTEVVVKLWDPLTAMVPQVSICVILANGAKINIEKSRTQLQSLPHTQSNFLVEANPATVLRSIARPGSVLLLSSQRSGYAHPERILVNAQESISNAELRTALQAAVRHGLQLLILNVGEALQLAAGLAEVGIPHMIVMREIMPDRVANEFTKLILKSMASGRSLPIALRDSRIKLQKVERVFPAVSWLPVLFQVRAGTTLHWPNLALTQVPTVVKNQLFPLNGDRARLPIDYTKLFLDQQLGGYYGAVQALAISLDHQYLISAHQDHKIRIWRLASGELLHELVGHQQGVQSILLTPDQQQLISAGLDGKILFWDLRTGQQLSRQIRNATGINTIVISKDGQKLLGGSMDGQLRWWSIANGQLQYALSGHNGSINTMAINDHGQIVVTAGSDGVICVWDLETHQLRQQWGGHNGQWQGMAMTADGQQVISAGNDQTIRVWEVATGQLLRRLVGHDRTISSLAITPDGRSIISGSEDRTIKIWNLADGRLLNSLGGQQTAVVALAVSPDGQYLATGGNGEIRIWSVP